MYSAHNSVSFLTFNYDQIRTLDNGLSYDDMNNIF